MFSRVGYADRCRRWAAVLQMTALAVLLLPTAGRAGEGESSLRRKIAWQVALDRVGFSPGVIDGRTGGKTQLATREFQRVHGLPMTGELDQATARSLKIDPDNVIGRYTIQPADLAEIGPVPKSWLAKSKLERLGHPSLDWVIAEKFHCARYLLATLNPGKNLVNLKAGDKVVVPILDEPTSFPPAAQVEINLAEKVIRVVGRDKQLTALFHCSVAASKAKLPSGQANVVCVVPDPTYTFDPKMWPDVNENITEKLTIPPGPHNPVGRRWIGLSLPGYGMHGTPNPELIGKTGSHGCFRLANWDAIRLSKMVAPGTPVQFAGYPDLKMAAADR